MANFCRTVIVDLAIRALVVVCKMSGRPVKVCTKHAWGYENATGFLFTLFFNFRF